MGASGSASIFDPNDGEDEGSTTLVEAHRSKVVVEDLPQQKQGHRRKPNQSSSMSYTEMSQEYTSHKRQTKSIYSLKDLPVDVDYSPSELSKWCPTYRKCFTTRATIGDKSYGCICFGSVDPAICIGASAVSIVEFPMTLNQASVYAPPSSKVRFKFLENKFYVVQDTSVQTVCATTAGIMDRKEGQRDVTIACTKEGGVFQTTVPLSEMLSGVFSNYGYSLKYIQTAREWLVYDRPTWFKQ
jgi:hypothetical protein